MSEYSIIETAYIALKALGGMAMLGEIHARIATIAFLPLIPLCRRMC
jgi:hypothetical protein